jgi:hypothetical protein
LFIFLTLKTAAPPGAVYDREKNVYRIIEQP